jgi:Protein of unknown function (DUF2911)
MKKIILIGVVVLVVLAVGGFFYLRYENSLSPQETTTFSSQGLNLKVVYCRPSKRGRLIFGEEKDGALQPFGKYWRLGANAATELTFDKNIVFAGKPVNAGTYRMYAVPGATAFQISLNSELGKGGASEPNYSLDVVKVDVPVKEPSDVTEKFLITFDNDSSVVNMNLIWDKTWVKVPILVP